MEWSHSLKNLSAHLFPVLQLMLPSTLVNQNIYFTSSGHLFMHLLQAPFCFVAPSFLRVTDTDTNKCVSICPRVSAHANIRENNAHSWKCGAGPQANSFDYKSRAHFWIALYALFRQKLLVGLCCGVFVFDMYACNCQPKIIGCATGMGER